MSFSLLNKERTFDLSAALTEKSSVTLQRVMVAVVSDEAEVQSDVKGCESTVDVTADSFDIVEP